MIRNKLIIGSALAATIACGFVGTAHAGDMARVSVEGPLTAQMQHPAKMFLPHNVVKVSAPVAPAAPVKVVTPVVPVKTVAPVAPVKAPVRSVEAPPVAPVKVVEAPIKVTAPEPVKVSEPVTAPSGQGGAMGNAGKNAPTGPPPVGVIVSPIYGH